ncbi:MAG: FAD-binding oxidoreductase [Gaiellaceae bacterium]
MRDLILGVTVALVDGTVASSGGKVVKNVAGYDLAKLFCGSRGTLGLVVRAAFRLHPRPECCATLEVPVGSAREARDTVRALQRSTLVPSALDLLWPGRVLALLEGSPGVVAAQSVEATRLVAAAEIPDEVWLDVGERQAGSRGTLAFSPGDLDELLLAEASALVRPSIGVAYLEREVDAHIDEADSADRVVRALRARVRAAFDPGGVLVG